MNRGNTLAWAAFAAVSIIWGTTYLAVAVALETLPNFLFPAARYILAGAILLAICLIGGLKLPDSRTDWTELALIGFLMVAVGNPAIVFAERHVPSGLTALLVATGPFVMSLLEWMRPGGERLTRRQITGLVIGFSGVALLVSPALRGPIDRDFLIGVLVIQIGSVAWSVGAVRSKYLSKRLSPLVAAGTQMLLGGVFALVIGFGLGEAAHFEFNRSTLLAFIYLVIFGSVIAYGAFVYALSKLPTALVALHEYINPAIAIVAGWLILSEQITSIEIISMVVILAGAALVHRPNEPIVPIAATAAAPRDLEV